MRPEPSCPRCAGTLRPPGLWSNSWSCEWHGAVEPQQPFVQPTPEYAAGLVTRAALPFWAPWPLPRGWVITGLGFVGEESSRAVASIVACTGPNPAGGAGDLLLVAEDPGVGLGARYAGLPGPDPGDDFGVDAPHAKVHAGGQSTSLWSVPSAPDRAVYAGEASGRWLWAVMHPESAGLMLLDLMVFTDLRELGHEIDLLPFGALCPRLAVAGAG